MNQQIQELKNDIKELNSQISSKYEEIRKIQLICSHEWVDDKIEHFKQWQLCTNCTKIRYRESWGSPITTTAMATFYPPIADKDGWYYV